MVVGVDRRRLAVDVPVAGETEIEYVARPRHRGTFAFGAAGFEGSIPFLASCGRLSYWPGVGEIWLSGFDFVSADVHGSIVHDLVG